MAFTGWVPTMCPGAKLIELIEEHKVTLGDLQSSSDTEEIIILKRPKRGFWDGGGKPIPYKDNANTRRYREELRDINDWLAKADIRFDASTPEKPVDVQAPAAASLLLECELRERRKCRGA